jgi:acetoin utilization protein AcuC
MERIEAGFSETGELHARLDGSTPFRRHEAEHSIRLRSWAIHDGILGEPFTNVTMYKRVTKSAEVNTCPSCQW